METPKTPQLVTAKVLKIENGKAVIGVVRKDIVKARVQITKKDKTK